MFSCTVAKTRVKAKKTLSRFTCEHVILHQMPIFSIVYYVFLEIIILLTDNYAYAFIYSLKFHNNSRNACRLNGRTINVFAYVKDNFRTTCTTRFQVVFGPFIDNFLYKRDPAVDGNCFSCFFFTGTRPKRFASSAWSLSTKIDLIVSNVMDFTGDFLMDDNDLRKRKRRKASAVYYHHHHASNTEYQLYSLCSGCKLFFSFRLATENVSSLVNVAENSPAKIRRQL